MGLLEIVTLSLGLSDLMLRTQVIGFGLIVIGVVTASKFQSPTSNFANSAGVMLFGLGAFLMWNGYVANYNNDPSFAIFN